jgi:hypothetical protein
MQSRTLSPLAAQILKLVGFLLILAFLLDLLVLLTTAKFQDPQWLVTFTTQLVDRGFVCLIGLAFLFTGLWIDNPNNSPNTARELKLAALLMSSILGLVFVVMIPLNITSTRAAVDAQVQQVNQDADNALKQLDAQVQQQLDARLTMVEQALKSGQLSDEQATQAKQQLEQLKKLKSDPKALEAQVGPDRKREIERINRRKQEVVDQAQQNAMRAGMRTGLNSLLLAIGFAFIGWTGLRQLLGDNSRGARSY